MEAWMRYLISLLIIAHGLVYMSTPFMGKATAVFQGWKGSSALLGSAVSGGTIKTLATSLWVIAGLGFLVAGIFIAFISLSPGLWRPIAIVAALAGTLSFLVFWDGQAQQAVNQGAIGVAISIVVLLGAVGFSQAFS